MAFNIRDLTRLSEFEMDTSAFGRVRIGNLKVSDVDAAEQTHTEQQANAEDIARMLFTRLASRVADDDNNSRAGDELMAGLNASDISTSEVEEFAKQLLKYNKYFSKTAHGDEIDKDVDESFSEFLLRLILQYRVSERERWEKLMGPVASPVFGNATRTAWAESVLASSKLGATLDALRAKEELIHAPKITALPPIAHPMRGTNERLDTLVERLEDYRPALVDTAAAIVALERTVREMQADFASNSVEGDRRMFRAEVVAIISLVFTALGFATSTYFSAKQSNDDSIVKEIHSMRTEQEVDRKNLTIALEKLAITAKTVNLQKFTSQPLNTAPLRGREEQLRTKQNAKSAGFVKQSPTE